MANGNKCNTDGLKYSKEHYVQIALAYEIGGLEKAQAELEELYGKDSSYIPVILEALEDGSYNEYRDFTPAKETSSEETPVLFNGAKKSEAPENDDLDRYYFNRENGWAEQREAEMQFVNEVLSRVLYNKHTKVFRESNTEKVNAALYEYKLELLNDLWKATGKDHSEELDGTDSSFNRVINQTCLEFGNIAREQDTHAYNNYIILKQFNYLIPKYVPFIKFDPAYENVSEHGKNMYIWNPSGKYRSNWTDSEEVDINNVTSPVIQTLLRYIPRVDANGKDMIEPLGPKTYNTVMSTILTWTRQHRDEFEETREICQDIRKNGLNADYNRMVSFYMKTVPISEEQKSVIRGIQRHILSNTGFLPNSLKMSLINQFFIQAKFSYFSLRVVDGKIKGQYLEDGFVSTQANNLMRSITTTVRMMKEEKEMYERLKKSVGVSVELDGNDIIINLNKSVFGEDGKIIVKRNPDTENTISITSNVDGSKLNPKAVINLIERVLERNIPDDYTTILDSMSVWNAVETSLFDVFIAPIAITLAAVEEENPYIFSYNDVGELNTFKYKSRCSDAANFIGIDKGVNELSTLINGEGNRLPIYQLAPAIFDLFDLIDYYVTANGDSSLALTNLITNGIIGSSKEKSVFPENPYVQTPSLLKRIVARSDTKVKSLVKSSDKLDVAEVANAAIFSEFYSNLMYIPDAKEHDRSTNRELTDCILMQPIVFSDKKTHFLIAVNLAKAAPIDYINAAGQKVRVSALDALRALTTDSLDIDTRKKYVDAFKTQAKTYIGDRTKRELYNQYVRFKNVFILDKNKKYKKNAWLPENANFKTFNALSAFYEIIDILSEINKEADLQKNVEGNYTITPLELIRKAFADFRASGIGREVALNEDFDFRVLKDGHLQGNETVFFNIKTALGSDTDFDRARTRDIKYFAMGLIEHDIFPDLIKNPELGSYFENIKDKEKWIDSVGDFMRPFITYKNGKRIEFTTPEIENDALLDPEVTVELNPILEAYFWAHNVYAVPVNDLIFGIQENYTPKIIKPVDFKTADALDVNIEEMMASSLSMEFKRTTYAGAVKRSFATGLQFGVPDMINWAGIDTTKRKISTIRGETHSAKTQDGNGWVDPILARMIQRSLLESPVGDVRKTIGGYVDPQTGAQMHFKWAEDTITTILRQRNDGDGSLEMMLKKGRGRFNIREKFRKVTNFKRYYNPNADENNIYKVGNEVLTHTDYIYQYDIDNGIYYRLDEISVSDGNVTVYRTKVDGKTGKPILGEKSEPTQPKRITNLYELDQILGGAWVFDFKDGNMVASEAVNDIIFHIVCENNMKNDFIGYFVGAEANKAGHFNFNSYDRLNVDDTEPLAWHALRAKGFGVLQNSDHELDFSDVTEMTQMITLLSQNGRNVELVNQMYEDIGRVANEALSGIIKNLNNENEIYRILGKALISSFATGTREELGLAQAFIRSTQIALEQNGNVSDIVLPYSAETIKGSFIAAVTSLINKKGIRRKYAGFGGVEVGAEDIMVHWDVGGKYLNYREARDYYRDMCKNYGITWNDLISKAILPDGRLNPSMRLIQQNEVNFGDTVYIRKKGSTIGKSIKIVQFADYDLVTALLDPNEWDIYLWEAKSKQLGQSNQFYKTDKREFSEYNTDYVRAMFYLDDLLAAKKYAKKHGIEWTGWTGENVDRKIRVLQAAITDNDMSVVAGWSIENLINTDAFDHLVPQIQKMLRRKQSVYLNKISQIKRSRVASILPTQMVEKNDQASLSLEWYDVKNGKSVVTTGLLQEESVVEPVVRKVVAQAAMGRKGAEKFLIRKGDKLSEIKERKQNFFYERLTERADNFKRTKSQLGGLQYDAVLQLNNGENLIVFVGNPNNGALYEGQDFVMSSDAISYKGRVIVDNKLLDGTGSVSEIITKSYSLRNGDQIIPALIVKDFETLRRLTKSSEVQQHRYNYTKKNWKDLVAFKKDNVSVVLQDQNNEPYNVKISQSTLETLPIDNPANISTIVNALNREELRYNRKRLMDKAQLLYRNFMASLSYIQTRIPSQAMESTMELEIVDILDIDTNYLWIPLMTHLFQGSDLDIDKGYCMGYDIDENGNILAESDLIYNPILPVDDVILLPKPNNSTIGFMSQLATTADQDTKVVEMQELIDIIKQGEGNNWTLMDYIREINKFTDENSIVAIEDFNISPDNSGNLQIPTINGNVRFLQKTWDLIQQAIEQVNIHNASKYDERRAAGALRNKVFVAARTIISEPSSQMDHMKPVSTDEAKEAAASSALGKKEKHLSIYQPLTIYEMQQQNMTGKTVIPLTATGIKSFFIISTGFNTIVHQIEKLLGQLDPNDEKTLGTVGVEIAKLLNQITFDSVFTPNGENTILRTFANINFDPLLEIADRFEYPGADGRQHNHLNEIFLREPVEHTKANEQCWGQFVDGTSFRLLDMIQHLDRYANGNTWLTKITKDEKGRELVDYEYFVVNAADSLGVLLNAATDNAKELILEKLNANQKFADYYVALLMMGHKFSDIAKEMTSGAFRIVKKYASENIFDPATHRFSIENSIDFVLDEDDLNNIDKNLLSAYIINNVVKGNKNKNATQTFDGFGRYILSIDFAIKKKTVDGRIISSSFIQELYDRLKLTDQEIAEVQSSTISTGEQTDKTPINVLKHLLSSSKTDLKYRFAKVIIKLLNDYAITTVDNIPLGRVLGQLLVQHIKDAVESTPKVKVVQATNPGDEYEPEPDYSDAVDLDNFGDYAEVSGRKSFTIKTSDLSHKDLKNLYRYVKLYLLPKNEAWNSLPEEEQKNGVELLHNIKYKIIPAVNEIKMIGRSGGINQGLRVGDYEEYSFIEDFNNFVNKAYMTRGKDLEGLEEFDLLRFLDDSKKDYHDKQIQQYDRVKVAVNVLQALDGMANFKAMFKFTKLNRDLITHSVAVKFERMFAKEALLYRNETSTNGLNTGLRYKFNRDEFKLLQRYTRNLVILNFFKRYGKDLSIKLPKGVKYYDITSADKTINPNNKVTSDNGRRIVLDNTKDLATFKHLMDTYIIPKLIQDERFENEAFIRALTKDDDSRDDFTGIALTGYKLSIPLTHLESVREINDYSRVFYSFNKLLCTPIPEDYNLGEAGHSQWTIGNLFFLYNLMTYKDRIGGNSMTRLLEDAISSRNKGTLTDMYYRYISNLDKGVEDIYNEDGSIDPTRFAYDIRDLLRWLAVSNNADYKFGVSSTKIGKRFISISVNGDSEQVITDRNILSDFVFNMLYLTKTEGDINFNPAKSVGNINRQNRYKYNSKDVFDAIVNAMYEKYTKDLPIAVLDNDEIAEWFKDYSPEEIEALQNSTGFIINGEIYLNSTSGRFSLDAPLHEMMHFVAAAMKFNPNPTIRNYYYKLLDMVTERMVDPKTEEDKKLVAAFNDEKSPYRNRVASDKAEEYLVTLLARQFQEDFKTTWGEDRISSKELVQANVRKVLAEIFKNSKVQTWEQPGVDISKIPLGDFVYLFADQILTQDPKLLNANMMLSQELADLKNFLEKHGFITLENCV